MSSSILPARDFLRASRKSARMELHSGMDLSHKKKSQRILASHVEEL
jgi:hypothetical protein